MPSAPPTRWAATFEARRAVRWATLVPTIPDGGTHGTAPPAAMAREQLRKLRRLPYAGTFADATRTNAKNIAKAIAFPLDNVPTKRFPTPDPVTAGRG
jgi:hypothetical protein